MKIYNWMITAGYWVSFLCNHCSICGGLTPSGASQPPQVYIDPQKISQNIQKYIADPHWFYHKSSTVCVCHYDTLLVTVISEHWTPVNNLKLNLFP